MPPDTAKNVGNPTGNIVDACSPHAQDSVELLVSGADLSSDGLDELAELLLKLGRTNATPNNR